MIARHSLEQSGDGEGVEIITNEACEDAEYGKGQYTEKRIHLSRFDWSFLTPVRECDGIFFSFLVVCHTGYKLYAPEFSMSQKSRGTSFHSQRQVSVVLIYQLLLIIS